MPQEVRSINKKLTAEDRKRHQHIRNEIENERAELTARGKHTKAKHDTLRQAVAALKATRKALGLTLNDIKTHTGIEKSNLSRLENDPNPNPTIDTLCRYAEAVGKEISITLVDKT